MRRFSPASSRSVSPTRIVVVDTSDHLSPPQAHDASLPPYSAPSPLSLGATPMQVHTNASSRDGYFPPLSLHGSSRPPSRSRAGHRPSLPVPEDVRLFPGRERLPSIRLIRRSSVSPAPTPARRQSQIDAADTEAAAATRTISAASFSGALPAIQAPGPANRPRSLSQPALAALPPPRNVRRSPDKGLPRLTEEGVRPTMAELNILEPPLEHAASLPMGEQNIDPLGPLPRSRLSVWKQGRLGKLLLPGSARQSDSAEDPPEAEAADAAAAPSVGDHYEYHDDLVDFLDVVDPEIQTLSTLTNVQNSLFIPDLGNLINRRPAYSLSSFTPPSSAPLPYPGIPLLPAPPRPAEPAAAGEAIAGGDQECQLDRVPTIKQPLSVKGGEDMPVLQRSNTITSQLSESHYAALPHGMRLEGWTDQEKRELDDHVRHMLHSRRSRLKRMMKGFGQYVRRPLGFFVTLYAVLITLFGLAWVLFLIGWIYVGDHQVYAIHIIDSVLVALFAVMGDGLAPFRAVDTYHMAFVVHYSRKIARAKKKLQMGGGGGKADGKNGNGNENGNARKKRRQRRKELVLDQDSNRTSDAMDQGSSNNGGEHAVDAVAPALDPIYPHEALGAGTGNDSDSMERIAASTNNVGGGGNKQDGDDKDIVWTDTATEIPAKPKATSARADVGAGSGAGRGGELDLERQMDMTKAAMEWQEETYLSPVQLKRLRHHQRKLAKSHSFYKPYETFTHNAFPLSLLIAVVVLLDLHSCLQISLGATTWGIDYHHRPAAITTVILCLSITANTTAGLVITLGDRRTRKKEVVDLLKRQELTSDAIKQLETRRAKEASKSHDVGTEEGAGSAALVQEVV